MVFQVAGVNKPFGSVSKTVNKEHRIVFHDEPGASYIFNKKMGQVTEITERNGVSVLDAWTSTFGGPPLTDPSVKRHMAGDQPVTEKGPVRPSINMEKDIGKDGGDESERKEGNEEPGIAANDEEKFEVDIEIEGSDHEGATVEGKFGVTAPRTRRDILEPTKEEKLLHNIEPLSVPILVPALRARQVQRRPSPSPLWATGR